MNTLHATDSKPAVIVTDRLITKVNPVQVKAMFDRASQAGLTVDNLKIMSQLINAAGSLLHERRPNYPRIERTLNEDGTFRQTESEQIQDMVTNASEVARIISMKQEYLDITAPERERRTSINSLKRATQKAASALSKEEMEKMFKEMMNS